MKQAVIREMTSEELSERLENEVENFGKIKMNHTVSPLENPMLLREKRRTIARLKTEIRKRELADIKN
ncbi:MAG TPA: 50S ribosomal protein L29 [Flavobacteriales bacterium]|jgi:large subunit ribosomal protein L29|nr:50S ribosomal protein L29 [Flavobacteriales bacterium]